MVMHVYQVVATLQDDLMKAFKGHEDTSRPNGKTATTGEEAIISELRTLLGDVNHLVESQVLMPKGVSRKLRRQLKHQLMGIDPTKAVLPTSYK